MCQKAVLPFIILITSTVTLCIVLITQTAKAQQHIYLPLTTNQSAIGVYPMNTNHRELMAKAQADGSVSILVGLSLLPNTLSGETVSKVEAIALHRRAIASTQQALLTELAGYSATAYSANAMFPQVALVVDAEALQRLLASPLVSYIQEDILMPPLLANSTSQIGAPAVWAAGHDGAGQAVVLVDTGIDSTHPFLGDRVIAEACFSNADGQGKGISLCPDGSSKQIGPGAADATTPQCEGGKLCGHGTHIAGIAAGNGPDFSGVARGASIIAIQVFTRFDEATTCLSYADTQPPCLLAYASDQIRGLEHALELATDYPIAAVNLSLGSNRYVDQTRCDAENAAHHTAIDSLQLEDIATIVATGNNGWTHALSAPGCISSAISVAAVNDGDGMAAFSNLHPMVDLLAPGVEINSSVPGNDFATLDGTSMAAPHVTGAWAILKSLYPTATVSHTLDLLRNTGVLITDTRPGGMAAVPRIQLDAASGIAAPLPCNFVAEDEESLNRAIRCANVADDGVHVIQVQDDILLQASPIRIYNPRSDQITIEGNGYTIDGQQRSGIQIFELGLNTPVVIRNLTIRGGNVDGCGGGIYTVSPLTLFNSIVQENQANRGGGICNPTSDGNLTLDNSAVHDNYARDIGGGIRSSYGNVVLRNQSLLYNNYAGRHGGGLHLEGGELLVESSLIYNNIADGVGGGLYLTSPDKISETEVHIQTSTIRQNVAHGAGGGLAVNAQTDVTITASTLHDNYTNLEGAGVYLNDASSLALINSTVSSNEAGLQGGGLYVEDQASAKLIHATISQNRASQGGGLYSQGDNASIELSNSIVAEQFAGEDCDSAEDSDLISNGHNLDSDGSCGLLADGDIPNGKANLGALTDNGGASFTHALQSGSDAIDGGDHTICLATPVNGLDQREVARPLGIHCDIGAFEFEVPTQ